MPFLPATHRRCRQIAPAAYDVRKNGNGFSCCLRISQTLKRSAKFREGDAVRLDLGTGADAGLIRLTRVSTGTRHWYSTRNTHNLYVTLSYTPELEALLPFTSKLAPLEVADISQADGITLKAPDQNLDQRLTTP